MGEQVHAPHAGCARRVRIAAGTLLLLGCAFARAQESAEEDVTPLDLVTVVGVSPIAGTDIAAMKLPYAVQSIDDGLLQKAQTLDLSAFMQRRLAGVGANAAQGNPLQPDLQFRGYTATPLLGGSEGVSVFLDGVRVNEVFGDTVNWDLVPTAAIERMSLLAGANPVFGLNTLGGAISIQTKSGFSDPGTRFDLYGGSFGRSEATFEAAGNAGAWGGYLMGNRFDEAGWRDRSPSHATTFYDTLSWRGKTASFDLHLGHAETDLVGNGAAPASLLAADWRAVFTAPDRTSNRMDLVSGQGHFDLGADTRLALTLFRRKVDTRSYNGDARDFGVCADTAVLCDANGEPIVDQHAAPISSAFDAVVNLGTRRQRSDGATVQLARDAPIGRMPNQLVVGIDGSEGWLDFASAVEMATLGADRRVSAGSGVFVASDALALDAHTHSVGLYATDTLSVTQRLALTLSGRANRTRTMTADRGGNHPDLDGRHAFSRFNPAAGATWQWSPALNAYAGYSESTRAPTSVELTCAEPNAPCKLPNQFLSDPPLQQVVAKSWEAGLRGAGGERNHLRWRIGLFRTRNAHDILFQSTGGSQSNQGYFANVGDTRRQGIEADLSGDAGNRRFDWYANLGVLDATYRSTFSESSANHPDADDRGLIVVRNGERIPGLPKISLKLGADFALTSSFRLGAAIVTASGQYLRGDEANRLEPTGSYAVVDLHADWRCNEHIGVFARIDNAFDRRYATFGTLGDAAAVLPGVTDPRFLGPGQPRGMWVGLHLAL